MRTARMKLVLLLASACLACCCAFAAGAQAAGPVKLILAGHIGWEVNTSTKGNFCAAESNCKAGTAAFEPGGFEFPEGVAAGSPSGNLYVADRGNHRVQEITKNGEFVLMFGQDVNKTQVEKNGPQPARDLCTAVSKEKCGAGVAGSAAGALRAPSGIVVDPATGAVYLMDWEDQRVEKYTAAGEFVWMVGKEVNETTHLNLCTASSGNTCESGVGSAPGSVEKCAFDLSPNKGDGLAIGGTGGETVFVGDAQRVQELGQEGECDEHQIAIPAKIKEREPNGQITAIAANATRLDVVYGLTNVIDEFDITSPPSEPVDELEESPQVEGGGEVRVNAIALDAGGDLAVSASEGEGAFASQFGILHNAGSVPGTFEEPTVFTVPGLIAASGVRGISFDAAGNLYAEVTAKHELLGYARKPVAGVQTGSAVCAPDAVIETDDTFRCTLHGTVNPFDVPMTEAWIESGRTCSHNEDASSPLQKLPTVEEPLDVEAPVSGLRPNQEYCYRTVALDENVGQSEPLLGKNVHVKTATVPPRIVGDHEAAFVTSASAVLIGELNPENAETVYFVEYGLPEDLAKCSDAFASSCAGVVVTETLESQRYGKIGATFEATALAPDTTYGYRLNAVNFKEEMAEGEAQGSAAPEGEFTTSPAFAPEATTGTYTSVGTTGAVVSGTVNPGGRPATYSFEVGIANGANTQYGVVVSGPVPAVTTPVEESFGLSGLQPGTQYAYRITLSSKYVENEAHTVLGAPVVFATAGLAAVIEVPVVPNQLPLPPIKFPSGSTSQKGPTRAELLSQALKACKKKPKKRQASCRRQAQKRYGAKTGPKKKK